MRLHYLNQHRIVMSIIEWLKALAIPRSSEPLNRLFGTVMRMFYSIYIQNVPGHLEL